MIPTPERTSGSVWGGTALAIVVAVAAENSARWIGEGLFGFESSPVSAIMLAIIFGMVLANLVALPDSLQPGLRFCTRTVLRLGVALLGIRLSLLGAGTFTIIALPFVAIAIVTGIATVTLLGRALGLSRQLTGLIAIGTSICGCTAIVATAPLIRARESEVSYAVACVTVFGIVAMFAYPLLANGLFGDVPALAGLFMGTSIHETAQVAGAGMMYEARYAAPQALDTATVTKLVRNLCMIAAIPVVGVLFGRGGAAAGDRPSLLSYVPWFIVGFAAMSALRTVGDIGDRAFGLLDRAVWANVVAYVQVAAEALLLVAMSAVGLTSMLTSILAIGLRPFVLGLFAAAVVGGVSLLLITTFGATLVAVLQ
ncbi:MAG: putative sulfate exporter family transporter [Woeseiaceae bacterium]|nr:putative sulfate exporter family transporter [Woeseiaceae bacterium]